MSEPLREILAHADALFRRGEYGAAIQHFERVIAGSPEAIPSEAALPALSGLAACWANLGRFNRQAEYAARLLNRARDAGHHFYIGMAALQLAYALGMLDPRNQWPTIRAALEEGLDAAHTLRDRQLRALQLIELAKVAVDVKHDPAETDAWLDEALLSLPLPSEPSNAAIRYRVYRSRARLCQDRGDPGQAWEWARAAVMQAEENGNAHFVQDALVLVAELDQEQGRPADALARAEGSIAEAHTHRWQYTEHQGQAIRAEALLDLKRLSDAGAAARAALDLALDLELREKEVVSLLRLGRVLLALGDPAQARPLLKQAHSLSVQRGYPDHAERAAQM
mgnify:CR=1 FL=1